MCRRSIGAGERTAYHSYLLRLWREGQTGEAWRASMQSAITGERLVFANLDDLFRFIRCQTDALADGARTTNEEEVTCR